MASILNSARADAQITVSSDGLTATASGWPGGYVEAIHGKASGKWFWEVEVNNADNANTAIGISTGGDLEHWLGQFTHNLGYWDSGEVWYNNAVITTLATYANGDRIGVAMDLGAGKCWFYKNGTLQSSGDPASGTGGHNLPIPASGSTRYPALSPGVNSGTASLTFIPGDEDWETTAPSGFTSLNPNVQQMIRGSSAVATTTFGFRRAPANGNLIVLAFASDDYNGTPNTGWTQSSEMEQQTFHGGYIWWRLGDGSTNSFQYTIGSASPSAYIAFEISGVDASPYDASEGQFTQASASTQATPNITPTSGDRILIAAMGISCSATQTSVTHTWTNSFDHLLSSWTPNAAGSRDAIGASIRQVTADGSTAYNTTGTYVGNGGSITPQSRSGLIIAFKESAGGGPVEEEGTLDADGVATVAFVGRSKWTATLDVDGLAATSFTGRSRNRQAFTMEGEATISFEAFSKGVGTLSVAGEATVDFAGATLGESDFNIDGTSDADFVGQAFVYRAVTFAAGPATAAFVGRGEVSTELTATGEATASFEGRTNKCTLTVTAQSFAVFSGYNGNGGSVIDQAAYKEAYQRQYSKGANPPGIVEVNPSDG